MEDKIQTAIEARPPPDFLFSIGVESYGPWGYEDRALDLTEALGPFIDLFDTDLLNGSPEEM